MCRPSNAFLSLFIPMSDHWCSPGLGGHPGRHRHWVLDRWSPGIVCAARCTEGRHLAPTHPDYPAHATDLHDNPGRAYLAHQRMGGRRRQGRRSRLGRTEFMLHLAISTWWLKPRARTRSSSEQKSAGKFLPPVGRSDAAQHVGRLGQACPGDHSDRHGLRWSEGWPSRGRVRGHHRRSRRGDQRRLGDAGRRGDGGNLQRCPAFAGDSAVHPAFASRR